MAALPDRQELTVTIASRVSDTQGLQASVYAFRAADRQALSCAVAPRMVDRQLTQVSVANTAFRAAAESAVIAPIADITFL